MITYINCLNIVINYSNEKEILLKIFKSLKRMLVKSNNFIYELKKSEKVEEFSLNLVKM